MSHTLCISNTIWKNEWSPIYTKLRIWQHVTFSKLLLQRTLLHLTNELWHVQKLRKCWQAMLFYNARCSTSSCPASGFYYNIFWRLKRFLLTVNEPTIIETYKLCFIMSCQQKSVVISGHNNTWSAGVEVWTHM